MNNQALETFFGLRNEVWICVSFEDASHIAEIGLFTEIPNCNYYALSHSQIIITQPNHNYLELFTL